MSYMKEILTVVGTLGCAMGIGFVMQSSETANERYGDASDRAQQKAALQALDAETTLLEVQDIALTSAEFSASDLSSAVTLPSKEAEIVKASAPEINVLEPIQQPEVATGGCDLQANARPMAGAMVNVTLDAPCLPNERLTVHHNGMIFTQTTSKDGGMNINVPALAETAVFVFAFGNGDGAVAQATVEDLQDFGRVVLQWKGETGFQLHAFEAGSDYDGAGHVWAGKPRDVASAILGESGFVTVSGDLSATDPLLAEVYTYPVELENSVGSIKLSVEAEVIQANCGQEIEAKSLELRKNLTVKARDITLAVPDCDAVGNFLVLNNLLQDLKVASK